MFTVYCEKIPRRKWYYISFDYSKAFVDTIKNIHETKRKYNQALNKWEITIDGLFELMRLYKGSDKIHFEFYGELNKKIYIESLKKILNENLEKKKKIIELEKNKEEWARYKKELEDTYEKYSDLIHSFVKDGITLYKHQIVGVMYMSAIRNGLLSMEMGLGKSVISIVFAELNQFDKVIVITPNSLKFNYFNEVEKFTNSKAHIVNWNKNKYSIDASKYIIFNYEYFNRSNYKDVEYKWDKLKIGKIDCVISDECFTYDTLISTEIGEIKIGDIVEKKLDVKVLSYNHATQKIEKKRIKSYFNNGIKEVVKVKLSDGSVLFCTPVHKYYSLDRDKYIQIKDFIYGEKIIKKEMEIFRSKKRRDLSVVWVESVEVLESGDRRRRGWGSEKGERVYDIEIEDNHNYFADNILVSNCQALKNSKSNTYKNFKKFFKDKIFKNSKTSKIFMSGTPAPNRAHELYNVMNQIAPLEFKTQKHFYEYYCGLTYDLEFGGWDYNKNSERRLDELYHKIYPYSLRKRKIEVLDLPDKIYTKTLFELNKQEREEYEKIENNTIDDIIDDVGGSNRSFNILTKILRLRMFLSTVKAKKIEDLLWDIIDSDEKVVVIDEFIQPLKDLHEKFKKVSVLHIGEVSVEDRNEYMKMFQDPNSHVKIFFANLATANYGLTLTSASTMFILTLPYSVGVYDQVADRLHRISQTKTVNIYPTICLNTIDEKIYDTIDDKRRELNMVMDNTKTSIINEETAIASNIFNYFKDKKKNDNKK